MFMIYLHTKFHTHSSNGPKVKQLNKKLQKISVPSPSSCFTFSNNITPPTATYLYKVYYQDLKVNGASVAHATPFPHVVTFTAGRCHDVHLSCNGMESMRIINWIKI